MTMNNTPIPDHVRELPAEVDPLLSVKEAARLLRVSVPTFWRRVSDRTIPAPIKLGGLSRWPLSEIAAVVETAKSRRIS